MNLIAIIPARSNSKRIPNKNLLKINTLPILKIVYQNLRKMKIFNKIILSSDSNKIRNLASQIGYDIIINRPKSLSRDNTSTSAVIEHSINELEKEISFSHVCCVYPMAILIEKKDIKKGIKILKNKNEIVFPALKYSHPIQRAFRIKKSFVKYSISKKLLSNKTQLFADYFHDAGQFYVGQKFAWKNFENCKKKSFIISSRIAIDVDNYEDFENLKMKYYLNNKIT